ncbi:hypothetical protein VP758_005206 [Vibrio harveyi]|nr:hypothetical protein [Vibrio harveyi]
MKHSHWCITFFCLFSIPAYSNKVALQAPVSVEIYKNIVSSDVSIELSDDKFTVNYKNELESFSPIDTVLTVKSKTESNINYSLSVTLLQGRCDGNDINTVVKIDGTPIELNTPSSVYRDVNNKGRRHDLRLEFPKIKQSAVKAFECNGTVGIAATLSI